MTKSDTMRAAGELGLSVAEHPVDASQRTVQRTVTRVDLAEAVYRCVGLSRKESAILVQSVLDELADALIGGEAVKLSSFGRFLVRAKSERRPAGGQHIAKSRPSGRRATPHRRPGR